MSDMHQHNQTAISRHSDELKDLLNAVLESPAVSDHAARIAAFENNDLQPPLRQYVAKIQDKSYRITEEDIQALLAAGYSQDSVFENTVAAALGAAMRRLQAGLQALQKDR